MSDDVEFAEITAKRDEAKAKYMALYTVSQTEFMSLLNAIRKKSWKPFYGDGDFFGEFSIYPLFGLCRVRRYLHINNNSVKIRWYSMLSFNKLLKSAHYDGFMKLLNRRYNELKKSAAERQREKQIKAIKDEYYFYQSELEAIVHRKDARL